MNIRYLVAILFLLVSTNVCAIGMDTTEKAAKKDIVAVVDDQPITRYELNNKIKLIALVHNVPDLTADLRSKIEPMALQELINDTILIQYATKSKIKIATQDIDNNISRIEAKNQMPKGQLNLILKERGIAPIFFRNQIEAEMIRNKIAENLIDSISVSPLELDAVIFNDKDKEAKVSLRIFYSKSNDSKDFKKITKLQKNIQNYVTKHPKNVCNIPNNLYQNIAETDFRDNTLLRTLDLKRQEIIKDLLAGQVSSIFTDNGQFVFILLCDRFFTNVKEQENDYVLNMLSRRKLSQKAEKFLEDLRKKAYVKINLPNIK